jgi:hypothetical protein
LNARAKNTRSALWRPLVSAPTVTLLATLQLASGCSTSEPKPFTDLASATDLHQSTGDKREYVYKSNVLDLSAYKSFFVQPVVIYHGTDAQFGGMSTEDRKILSDYMQKAFSTALPKPENSLAALPNVAKVVVTLTGAEASTPVLSTIVRVTPVGLLANAIQAGRGADGTFFGSVTYAVEISDAKSGQLICAYVKKSYPNALDITSSVGYLDAAKTGITKAARDLSDVVAADCR